MTLAFCLAISSTNRPAALFSAASFVVEPMLSVMDEDMSSTSTMSSGVVSVLLRLEVEESAVSDVRKSAPLFFVTLVSSS